MQKSSSKSTVVTLKYSFNIEKIRSKEMLVQSLGSSLKQQVYDISCFSAVKFHMAQVGRELAKECPGYEYKIYAYRATKQKPEGNVITALRFNYSYDHYRKFVHVNVVMIPQKEEEQEEDLHSE